MKNGPSWFNTIRKVSPLGAQDHPPLTKADHLNLPPRPQRFLPLGLSALARKFSWILIWFLHWTLPWSLPKFHHHQVQVISGSFDHTKLIFCTIQLFSKQVWICVCVFIGFKIPLSIYSTFSSAKRVCRIVRNRPVSHWSHHRWGAALTRQVALERRSSPSQRHCWTR